MIQLVSRGGMEGLTYVRDRAQHLLQQGVSCGRRGATPGSFDDDLIARNLSQEEQADLIRAWLLGCFPEGRRI